MDEKNKRWVTIALYDGESLTCDECDEEIYGSAISISNAHLCIDRSNEVDETMCSKCWEIRTLQKNEGKRKMKGTIDERDPEPAIEALEEQEWQAE